MSLCVYEWFAGCGQWRMVEWTRFYNWLDCICCHSTCKSICCQSLFTFHLLQGNITFMQSLHSNNLIVFVYVRFGCHIFTTLNQPGVVNSPRVLFLLYFWIYTRFQTDLLHIYDSAHACLWLMVYLLFYSFLFALLVHNIYHSA